MKKLLLASALTLGFLSAKAQQDTVLLNYGNLTSALSPFRFQGEHNANEFVLLQSELGASGAITAIAFQKIDGPDSSRLNGVVIRLKHTTDAVMLSGAWDTTAYTEVYRGDFTNVGTNGWQYVTLTTPFNYDGTSNLAVLAERRFGTPHLLASTSRFAYGNTSATRNRRTGTNNGILTQGVTSLTGSNVMPNTAIAITRGLVSAPAPVKSGFSLYPNPASQLVSIKTDQAAVLKLYSTTGQLVLTETIAAGQQSVSLSGVSAGLYTAQIITSSTTYTQKLVVE